MHNIADMKALWDQLRHINTVITGPWLIIEDFNSILHVEDMINGILVHQSEIADFQQCVEDIGIGQLTKKGSQYS